MNVVRSLLRATGVVATTAMVGLGLMAGTAQADTPPCPSLEGCYGYQDMQDFYDQVITLVTDFSKASYRSLPPPKRYWYIRHGDQLAAGPGCGTATENSYFYCPTNQSVYVGQDQLYAFYKLDGDAAAAFGIAHEWGHHVQHEAGVFDTIPAGDQIGHIRAENQADCVGGAFLGYLDKRDILEPDDYSDVDAIIPMIASAENDPDRDHGTAKERVQSVNFGLRNGLEGCSKYFPSTPLVTAA